MTPELQEEEEKEEKEKEKEKDVDNRDPGIVIIFS